VRRRSAYSCQACIAEGGSSQADVAEEGRQDQGEVMLGHASCRLEAQLKDFQFKPQLEGYAIKVPVFSFNKFPNVDKSLGPEMKSTGKRSTSSRI
jgi:hypothetical protein